MAEEGVGKKYYGMMDAVGKLGEFQSRLQNSSADEITAGNFAIPTIEGWLDTDTLSALCSIPLSENDSCPKVPFSQYQCRWYRTSRVLLYVRYPVLLLQRLDILLFLRSRKSLNLVLLPYIIARENISFNLNHDNLISFDRENINIH